MISVELQLYHRHPTTAALKTIYLFGCRKGTLVVSKVLGGFFVLFTSFETVGYTQVTLMGPVEVLEHGVAVLSLAVLSVLGDVLCVNFQKTFLSTYLNILEIQCENHIQENRWFSIKIPKILDKGNGYPENFL